MTKIERATAVHLVSVACRPDVDSRTRLPIPPDLDVLAHQRPEIAKLAHTIRDYLDASLTNIEPFRRDEDAIAKLVEALTMSLIWLRSTIAMAKDAGHVGVLSDLRTSLESLRAQLTGETLPDQQPLAMASGGVK